MTISCCENQNSIQIFHGQNSQTEEQESKISKETQSIRDLAYQSVVNVYIDSHDLQRVDPDAYAFVKLRTEEFIKLRDLNYERMSLSKKEVKKQAFPVLSFFSGLGLICNTPIVGAGMLASSLLIGSGASISLASGFFIISTAWRLQEHDADDIAISKASKDQLKGALRFCKACQKVDQIKNQMQDPSKGFFNRIFFSGNKSLRGRLLSTNSDESWLPCLARNPSWKDRISKIEKALKSQGEKNITVQPEEVDLLENTIIRFRFTHDEAKQMIMYKKWVYNRV